MHIALGERTAIVRDNDSTIVAEFGNNATTALIGFKTERNLFRPELMPNFHHVVIGEGEGISVFFAGSLETIDRATNWAVNSRITRGPIFLERAHIHIINH